MAVTVATPVVTQMDLCTQRPGRAINKITAALSDIDTSADTAYVAFPATLDAAPEVISVLHTADDNIYSVIKGVGASGITLTVSSITAGVTSSVSVIYQTVIG